MLNGSHSSSPAGEIRSYEWDINGDGRFGDLKGPEPGLAWTSFRLPGGATTISLRVTDSRGGRSTATATLTVSGAPVALYDVLRYRADSAAFLTPPVFGPDGRLYGMANDGGALAGGGALWRIDRNGRGFVVLREFERIESEYPRAIVFGRDARIYGVSDRNLGILWRVNIDGTGFQKLREFESADGARLQGAPAVGPDGRLYGTCSFEGLGYGTVWRVNPDGSGFVVLRHMEAAPAGAPPEGLEPSGPPIFGPDGNLYGVTRFGGAMDLGTAWRMKPDGSGYAVLRSMSADGSPWPYAALRLGPDQRLYGVAGNLGDRTVWRMNLDGSGFAVLRRFDDSEQGTVITVPIFGTDGRLYGTVSGRTDHRAALWRMNADGSAFTAVLTSDSWLSTPEPTELVQGPDSRLYGAARVAESTDGLWRAYPDGRDFEILREVRVVKNGHGPRTPPVFGPAGELYGVTFAGGDEDAGVLWTMKPNGTGYSLLHSFEDSGETSTRYTAVSIGPGWTLYGIGSGGGAQGDGTLWRIRRDGSHFTVLRSFDLTTDGGRPTGAPVFDLNGSMLFGTNANGGVWGQGTLWAARPDGTGFVVLRHFAASDGANPSGPPLFHPDGWLFGTTGNGGGNGAGTLWRVRPNGTRFAVLRHFNPSTDGSPGRPQAPTFPAATVTDKPVLGPDGRVYGITTAGGAYGGGTLWRINRDGTQFAVLRHFGQTGDGGARQGAPAFGPDGRIYGAAPPRSSAIWRIAADGSDYGIMASVKSGAVGAASMGPDGRLYGSSTGGSEEDRLGTFYSWSELLP